VPYVVYATTFAALGQGAAAPVGGGVAPITVPTLNVWALLLLIGLLLVMSSRNLKRYYA
jgi:hypothetical protein